MNEIESRQAIILEKIANLHDCVDRLSKELIEFNHSIGYKVEQHEKRITVSESEIIHAKENIGDIRKIGWAIFGSSLVLVLAAFWKLIIK